MLLADGLLLNFSFALAALIWEGTWAQQRAMIAAHAMLPAFYTIALYNGSYGVRALGDWVYATRKALFALLLSAALINLIAFYLKSNDDFSRAVVTLGLLFTSILLMGVRRVVAMLVLWRWGGRVRNRLVIDDGGAGFPCLGADRISAAEYNLDPGSRDPFMLDRLGKLLRNQDQVVVNCPLERRQEWAFLLKGAGVYGEIVS